MPLSKNACPDNSNRIAVIARHGRKNMHLTGESGPEGRIHAIAGVEPHAGENLIEQGSRPLMPGAVSVFSYFSANSRRRNHF